MLWSNQPIADIKIKTLKIKLIRDKTKMQIIIIYKNVCVMKQLAGAD